MPITLPSCDLILNAAKVSKQKFQMTGIYFKTGKPETYMDFCISIRNASEGFGMACISVN